MVTEEPKGQNPDKEYILTLDIVKDLWTKTYNTKGKPDWSHILPYYDLEIHFRDSIQELNGMSEFKAMTERLTKRSKDLKMKLVRTMQQDNDIFIECFTYFCIHISQGQVKTKSCKQIVIQILEIEDNFIMLKPEYHQDQI